MSVINLTSSLLYSTLSAAIAASSPGDTLGLSPGNYVEDFPLITHSLTIEGLGGMAHLTTPNPTPANNRAILFVAGSAGADLTVRNLEFSGATDPYNNGAGILFEVGNGNLSIYNSWFHNNQEGVLVCSYDCGTITIDGSEFGHNGLAPGSHNLYVGAVDRLTVTNSYFHDAQGGHEIKSRAAVTVIDHNRIQDGPTADTSYSIDLPNGGQAEITNNVIEQGPNAQNGNSIHFGGEGAAPDYLSYPGSTLLVRDNILINDRAGSSTAIYNQSRNDSAQSYGATVDGNTVYNFQTFYKDRLGAAAGPNDTIGANTIVTGPAPALDTSHPWEVPEPASGLLLGAGLLGLRWAAGQRRAAG